jgi:predicted nucleic acid-binding protein
LRLIDTNLVIYAAGKANLYKTRREKYLDRIAEGSLHANVDVELLQEILHVYAAHKGRAKGFDTIDDLLVLFPNPIPIGREEIETARDLMHSNSFLGARDAIHAAVVQTQDLEGIVTADKVFDRIKGVKRFDLR